MKDYMKIDLGKIISESWKIFVKNFWLIAGIMTLIFLPINLLLNLLIDTSTLEGAALSTRLYAIYAGIIGLVSSLAVMFITLYWMHGKKMSFGEAIKRSFSKWGSAIWTSILQGLIFLLFLLPAIVLGAIWLIAQPEMQWLSMSLIVLACAAFAVGLFFLIKYSILWLFSIQSVAFHGLSGKKALKHSQSVVHGRWWKVLGCAILLGIVGIFPALLISAISIALPDVAAVRIIFDMLTDIASGFAVVLMALLFFQLDAHRLR